MKKYWIEFEQSIKDNPPVGTLYGIGITSLDIEEALTILRTYIFKRELPPIRRIIEDVQESDLEKNHVLPNIGNIEEKGIWFPLGYS